jgi:transposase
VLEACGDGLASFVERLKARCAAAGRKIARVILTHEAGRDGFWLARFLARRGIEIHVIQPSSLPVDRRARRAKTDIIDVEMLLRTLMAWLRGEPRVCSMVRACASTPIPRTPKPTALFARGYVDEPPHKSRDAHVRQPRIASG